MRSWVRCCTVSSIIYLPVSVAARKGVSALVALSQGRRVALTSYGRVVAVIDSPDSVDERARQIRDAVWAVLQAAAGLTADRQHRYSLDELCARAGVDIEGVRERAAQIRSDASSTGSPTSTPGSKSMPTTTVSGHCSPI